MNRFSFAASVAMNVAMLLLGGAWLVHGLYGLSHVPEPSRQAVSKPLKPLEINPAWIKSGHPRFMATETTSVPGHGISTGLWSCDGPAVFDWTFGTDETVHILDGEVQVLYLGHLLTLTKGDTAFFRAGTTAEWRVRERVYKTFVLQDPGRFGRLYRQITGS